MPPDHLQRFASGARFQAPLPPPTPQLKMRSAVPEYVEQRAVQEKKTIIYTIKSITAMYHRPL